MLMRVNDRRLPTVRGAQLLQSERHTQEFKYFFAYLGRFIELGYFGRDLNIDRSRVVLALSAGIIRKMLWTVFVETEVSSFFETFVGLLELRISSIPFSQLGRDIEMDRKLSLAFSGLYVLLRRPTILISGDSCDLCGTGGWKRNLDF